MSSGWLFAVLGYNLNAEKHKCVANSAPTFLESAGGCGVNATGPAVYVCV